MDDDDDEWENEDYDASQVTLMVASIAGVMNDADAPTIDPRAHRETDPTKNVEPAWSKTRLDDTWQTEMRTMSGVDKFRLNPTLTSVSHDADEVHTIETADDDDWDCENLRKSIELTMRATSVCANMVSSPFLHSFLS